jgi:CubicO group peptidase (beta-lactamase class C family)
MLHGFVHPDFDKVSGVLRKILPKRGPGGAAVCVYHKGEKVVDCWGGTRDHSGAPWQEDTLSISFSTTKGVASTLLHVHADRGLIDYDAPVAEYWPEFAQGGKENTTVRQVMCHEAGLYAVWDMVEHGREMLDWDLVTRRIAEAEPRHAPGLHHGYHALTYGWLVGEIVRRVTGNKPFPELLESELARPLGLEGLYCGVPDDQKHRCATLMAKGLDGSPEQKKATTQKILDRAARWQKRLAALGFRYDPSESIAALTAPGMEDLDFNSDEFRAASIPAANGMFTARSLARLYACLAQGGELDGVRLLSYDTLRRATEQQNRGAGKVIPISMRWRLGYHRVFAVRAKVPGGFGHFGFGGSGAWADPQRQLAVALTVNSGVGTPFGDTRIARIGGAAVRCADRR